MAEFRMPSLGADMDSGTLLEWRVAPGDRVTRGQIVALVDTDKAEIEIECWQAGVVERLIAEVGQKLPVGAPLAWLREESEAVSTAKPATPALAVAPAATGVRPVRPVFASPRAPDARPPAPPPSRPRVAVGESRRVHASPLARRLAKERGLDLASLAGSGPGGAVIAADVQRAAAAEPPAERVLAVAASVAPTEAAAAPRDRREGMRRAIAASMAKSKREIPHYYLETSIDCGHALEWLRARNESRPVSERVLPVALLLAATAKALRRAPELNGFFLDGAFRPGSGVHLGVAVSLRGGGLVAPALRDADLRSLDELMAGLRELTQRAREGRLRSSEFSDATLTVTSLGDLGVDRVFPVIYPPQVAIVGFGRIAEAPWAERGMLAVRPVVRCTLAADHRVSDGMRGARFLAELARLLARPEEL
ncbi:MAG TPA: dihydrolipoamide acetyltransferase family protein [Myxococcota bacterium]|nr:dihydrolipoamide acetyltransferase family protein [Myxococcota bacterium]